METVDLTGRAYRPKTGPLLWCNNRSWTVTGHPCCITDEAAVIYGPAGLHWRTDYCESLTLSEAVAIGILEEQQATCNEGGGFTFTAFDGTTVTV